MKKLVIVESPTKAKTIRKFLPKDYIVDSSYGHIRDLPASAKEVPPKLKKEKWANIAINYEKGFEPIYVISKEKKKVVKRLKDQLKDADELILATDEDREGEGISWHIVDVLKPKVPYKRMVFHEITKEAIRDAIDNFREINMDLVNAQEARRFLDRLAGYTISPLLWKKIAPGLSAGRVQSVAVELLVQRERERLKFKVSNYWDLKATLNADGSSFDAELHKVEGKRVATGKDFDESTGKLKDRSEALLIDDVQAKAMVSELGEATWRVSSIDVSEKKRSPAPPFITSTLQQEANRKLGFSAKQTMSVAQRLYESGFITYMRTDSTNLSNQAIEAAREGIQQWYGDAYLHPKTRTFSKKAKGAQEAHEAIRPAGSHFRTPQETGLSGQEFKLYDLIWKRTVATQMAEARLRFTNAEVEAKSQTRAFTFTASGKEILFPGFFRAYVEGSDDPQAQLENQENPLPKLEVDQTLSCKNLDPIGHETKPPARFTEASLVRALEKEGVGRPSTYATIIDTIQARDYANKQGNALVPTFTAFAVTELLERHFPELVDVGFTSQMEGRLDDIAAGEEDWLEYLDEFYNGERGLKEMVQHQEKAIEARDAKRIDLPIENLNGTQIYLGKFGPYIQHGDNDDEAIKKSLPADLHPGDITPEKLRDLLEAAETGPETLGTDPETGEQIYALNGRYGPYVQLGQVSETNKKPKRASLLKGMKLEDIDLELALSLLSLPRTLGTDPKSGKEIKAGVGRYGPFVVMDGSFKSLEKEDNVLEITLNRAIELLEQAPKKKKSGAIKELGDHPEGGDIKVMTGRYGPYLKWGKKNVSLGKTIDPESVTMEQAIEIIAKKK